MILLFLDVDGVLLSGRAMLAAWRRRRRGEHAPAREALDPVALRELARVLARHPDVTVVLSSTRRANPADVAWLRTLPGIGHRITALCPETASNRPADNVQAYLDTLPSPTPSFVCVDDSATGLEAAFGPERVVRTRFGVGLTRSRARALSRTLRAAGAV